MSQEIYRPPIEVEMMLLNHGQPFEYISAAKFGASGPKVLFYRQGDEKLVALKYGQTRVPIHIQVGNFAELEKHLPGKLPPVLDSCQYDGGEAMLMEAVEGPTLHEAVVHGNISQEKILAIFEDILDHFERMWLNTRSETLLEFKRDPIARCSKVKDIIRWKLAKLGIPADHLLVVNGRELGKVSSLLSRLDDYTRPNFTVFCHSDLNGDNLLLTGYHDADDLDWRLIDLEWVGRHDWKLAMSHLIGYWGSNASELSDKDNPKIIHGKGRAEIHYQTSSPVVCDSIKQFCFDRGERIAANLTDRTDWKSSLQTLIAALLLGDIRFLSHRGREDYELPLLGEGFLALT